MEHVGKHRIYREHRIYRMRMHVYMDRHMCMHFYLLTDIFMNLITLKFNILEEHSEGWTKKNYVIINITFI